METTIDQIKKENKLISELSETIEKMNEILIECANNKLEVETNVIDFTVTGDRTARKFVSMIIRKVIKRI